MPSDNINFDIYDWPKGCHISKLEENLLCPLCKDAYKNPHSIKCGHVFCSECIRRHMDPHYHNTINPSSSAGKCPICSELCAPNDMRKERAITDIISTYSSIRKTLLELVESTSNVDDGEINMKSIISKNSNVIDLVEGDEKKPPPPILNKLSLNQTKSLNLKAMKDCLLNLVSKIMKATAKINVDGDKETLENRYRELIHLHNAQIGSDVPLTVNQVVTEINKRSKARSIEILKSKSTLKKIESLKNGNVAVSKFDWKHLVEQINRNKQKDKANTDENINEYNWDIWRVVMSKKVGKPFYYNTVTNIGQFEIPEALLTIEKNYDSYDNNKYPTLASTLVCDDEEIETKNGLDYNSTNFSQSFNNTAIDVIDNDNDNDNNNDNNCNSSFEKAQIFDNNKIIELDIDVKDDTSTWSCSTCTFVNDISRSTCEICQSKININPTPRRSNRSVSNSTDSLSTLLNGKRSQNENNIKSNSKKPKRK